MKTTKLVKGYSEKIELINDDKGVRITYDKNGTKSIESKSESSANRQSDALVLRKTKDHGFGGDSRFGEL